MLRAIWNARWDPESKAFLKVMLKHLVLVLQLIRCR